MSTSHKLYIQPLLRDDRFCEDIASRQRFFQLEHWDIKTWLKEGKQRLMLMLEGLKLFAIPYRGDIKHLTQPEMLLFYPVHDHLASSQNCIKVKIFVCKTNIIWTIFKMPVHVKKPRFSNSSLRLKMSTEDNGNIGGILKPTSSSNEDLSEYTDADESISAPTEFLAEVRPYKSTH